MNIEDIIIIDGKEWRVAMLTSAYATIELVINPKVSKMIRR